MRCFAASLLGAAFLLGLPGQSRAASYVAQDIWYSTLYGAAIGGMAGAGVMLLTDDPLDHSDYVLTGVGVGILAGLGYGIYSYSASDGYALAEVEPDGTTRYQLPMPRAFVSRNGDKETIGVEMTLIHGRF